MPSRSPFALRKAAFAAASLLALATCGLGADNDLSVIDNQIAGNESDPALTTALEDQIMVDPTLAQQANGQSVRPPETPVQAQYPVESRAAHAAPESAGPGRPVQVRRAGAPAQTASTGYTGAGNARSTVGQIGAACGAAFQYGFEWANRLPAAFPAYPHGRVVEAAGNNEGDCRIRVVTFTTRDAPERVLDWYSGKASGAGYSAERQRRDGDHVIGGTNEGSDGAFYLIVTPAGTGSQVALIVNNGR